MTIGETKNKCGKLYRRQ